MIALAETIATETSTDAVVAENTPAVEESTSTGTEETSIVEEVDASGELVTSDAPAVVEETTSTDETVVETTEEVDSASENPVVEETTTQDSQAPPTDSNSDATTPSASEAVVTTSPTLSTDKDDYHPGETATIFGKFFAPLQSFILKVFGSDENDQNYTESVQAVTTDENGVFTTAYTLDSLYRPFYWVTASSQDGQELAKMYFRDSSIGTYDQCSQDDGDGYATGDTGCRWINGNLNANNSTYFEGDSTVQRMWIEGYAPGSTHTVTFKYGTTKAGTHAYDYLTTWSASEPWVTVADRCDGITGCTTASETVLNIPEDPNVPNTIEPTASSTRMFVMRGGSLVSATTPTIASGSYAGDSETEITVTFKVANSGPMCSTKQGVTSCGAAIWFGAHVAKTSEWGLYNGTTGAGFISGSPYHVQLAAEDGASIGNRDNQMQSNTLPSQITIRKVTDPVSDPQQFTFTKTGNGNGYTSPYNLTGGQSNTQTVTPKNNQNTYVITESAVAQWGLTSIECTDNSSVTTTSVDLANRQVTIVLDLDSSSNVDCTFTNTKQQNGTIVVDKATIPSGDPQSFSFTTGGTGYNGFSLTDAAAPNSQTLVAGTYSVSETVPAGWDQTSATCSDGSPINAISLQAGETVTCTFTNTKRGSITVVKNTVGGNGTFNFTSNFGVSQLTTVGGTASQTANNLVPGTYSVSETVPAGWDLTSATCSDGSNPSSIGLSAGESVTCTFTNTKRPTLTVNKVVVPAQDSGLFNLRIDGNTAGTGANVGNGGTTGVVEVSIGAHTVSETAGTGTSLSDYTAVIGGNCGTDGSVTLAAGENKVCTITNTRNTGTIELKKIWSGTAGQTTLRIGTSNGGSQVDSQLTGANGAAPLTTGQNTVNTGTYYLSETGGLTNYTASALVCFNDANNNGTNDGESSVTVGANDSVTVAKDAHVICTYTNTRDTGTVIVKKVMVGGTSTFDFTGTPNGSISVNNGTIQQVVDTGTYNSTETPKAGWDLTSISCDDNNSTGNVQTGVATFNVEKGETVTCTFTNTKRGVIVIEKQTLPDLSTQEFGFTGEIVTSLIDGNTSSKSVAPGQYTVTETALAGWDLTSLTCNDNNSTGDTTTGTATFNVEAGETVKCTFTNTQRGHIIVDKVTDPSGDPQSFDFTVNYGNNFSLTDAATPNDQEVVPGTYSVSETVPEGWDLTSATCSDGSPVNAIVVGPGETVTCTFNNQKDSKIIIVKQTLPDGDSKVFDFTASYDQVGFSLSDGQSNDSGDLNPGTYSVSETVPTGWQLDSATCSDGSPIASIDLEAGETVTCTFTNEKLAKIVLVKNTIGGNDTFGFTMTGTGLPANQNLVTSNGTQSQIFENLNPDNTYTIAETGIPAGWANTGASCDQGETIGDIDLEPGETVTCTFTNNKPVAQIDVDPLTATNRVGDNHVITANVQVHNGDGNWGPAADGTVVTFAITNSNGATASFVGSNTCNTTAGTCSITINSPTPGNVSVKASATPVVLSVNLPVATGTGGLNSADAQKDYVNARISIGTTDTNEVNDDHTFTVLVEKSVQNSVWTPVQNAIVDATPSPVPALLFDESDCTAGTDVNGQCDIVLNSADAGIFTVNASTTISVGGVVFNLLTGTGAPNSDPAVKTYVDGSIALSPQSAVNKVGDPHTIFVHVTKDEGTGSVDAENVTVVFTVTNGAATFVGLDNDCVTDANGNCSVQIVSNTSGNNVINATATYTVGGVSITRATNGDSGPTGSDAAEKQYVNANISIESSATNKVGDQHIFKVTVTKNTGSGDVGIDGVYPVVTFSPSAPGTVTDNCDLTGTDGSGECTVEINSTVAGVYTASATVNVNVNTVPFVLTTNGQNGNSDTATKTYVDAKISINPPSAVNEVGDEHVLTATVMEDPGTGYVVASGETVKYTVIAGTATFVGGVDTCVTNGSGQCSVSIISNSVGDNTIKAVSDVGVSSLVLHRETDSTHSSSGPATKKYVDAYITITPEDATNPIHSPHVFTVTYTQVPGTATPAATANISVNVSPTPDLLNTTTCGNGIVFNANTATCTITINSSVPSVFTATATGTALVGGVSLTRVTDGTGNNSGTATKTYEAGALKVTKAVVLGNVVNPSGIDDTFTVTVTGPSYPNGHNIVFTVVDGVLQAPATVTLEPIIPGNYIITEADAGTEWTETVPANAVAVVANETAEATVTNTYVPGELDVTKAVVTTGYLFANDYDQTFTITVTGPSYPSGTDLVFNVVNGVLNPATQTLQNLIPGSYDVTEANPGVMWTVSGNGVDVSVPAGGEGQATITNTIKLPSTNISLTANTYEATATENVTLTITDLNDGQVPISNPSVELLANNVLTVPQPTYVSGDTNTNSVMDVGETWTWTWTGQIAANTVFTVNGIGTDPLGNPVNGPTYASETESITVRLIGTTRTIGFWQTHTAFTTKVWNTYVSPANSFIGDNVVVVPGTTHKGKLTTIGQVFGGFYAPIAKTTTGTKRTPVDQARIQMLQQLLAAKLNCAAFGCSSSIQTLITNADNAYKAGADKNLIISLTGQLDAFNNSGDAGAIPPSLGATGKATPKTSQGLADLAFWNQP
jgi:hypothetical protein